jgi:hypothetical protein
VNGAEVALPPANGRAEVKRGGREHVASSGPKSVKVTVPVGVPEPATVAPSKIAPPRAIGPEACVVSVAGRPAKLMW